MKHAIFLLSVGLQLLTSAYRTSLDQSNGLVGSAAELRPALMLLSLRVPQRPLSRLRTLFLGAEVKSPRAVTQQRRATAGLLTTRR